MDRNIYDRIKALCQERHISLARLESDLGIPLGSIYSWKKSTPAIDRIASIAQYFGVSVDWIAGISDSRLPSSEILSDPDFVALQRAKTSGDPEDLARFRRMLMLCFDMIYDPDSPDAN